MVAEAIKADFNSRSRGQRAALDALIKQVTVEPLEAIAAGHPLAGQTIVFTGSMERMTHQTKPGAAIAEARLGQRFPGSISAPRSTWSSPDPAPRQTPPRRGNWAEEQVDEDEWIKRSGSG